MPTAASSINAKRSAAGERSGPVRVLVVDDSAVVRKVLTRILDSAPGIDVVGTAPDALVARDKIKRLDPDVVTLDIEMPRMDGITFLRKLMRLRPMPVVMISSLTERGADVTLEALEIGAVDFVSKPKGNAAGSLADYAEEIARKVRTAARARVRTYSRAEPVVPKLDADAVIPLAPRSHFRGATERLLAIGASTGGTEAIRAILEVLPASSPGIVIAQHIPAAFSGSFARRLDAASSLAVREASDGESIERGNAYVAPGDAHLLVESAGTGYRCRLSDGPPVNRHRPSVDVLFRSVASSAGASAVGVILTGMGDDGARGLLEMQEVGARTIAQDEASSVVWGMPGEAVKRGAAGRVLPLARIASELDR